jgi:hypothetical protein
MAFRPNLVPDFLDFSVRSNQKSAAHGTFENPAHELLRTPYAVCFDHFVGWIAKQGKIELLLFAEVRERFFRIGTGT